MSLNTWPLAGGHELWHPLSLMLPTKEWIYQGGDMYVYKWYQWQGYRPVSNINIKQRGPLYSPPILPHTTGLSKSRAVNIDRRSTSGSSSLYRSPLHNNHNYQASDPANQRNRKLIVYNCYPIRNHSKNLCHFYVNNVRLNCIVILHSPRPEKTYQLYIYVFSLVK